MTRPLLLVIAALAALLCTAGCSDKGDVPQIAEIDEPLYVQGVQLRKQGRNPEALTAFLKVLEKRGDRAAPESHFEAGVIYLNHIKEPVLAYYHFRKYLELQPNSKQAQLVRGQMDAALREFARRIPGRPLDDQSVRLAADEEVTKLRRENEELRAELATLRGGGASGPMRASRVIPLTSFLPQDAPAPPATNVPLPENGGPVAATPVRPSAAAALERPALVNTAPPPAPKAQPPSRGGRTHTVAPKETLYGISVRYYGHGRQVDAIFEANRDVMRSPTDLKIGMTLRIP